MAVTHPDPAVRRLIFGPTNLVLRARRSLRRYLGKGWLALLTILAPVCEAQAQTVPTIDTEDATIGSDAVSSGGWLHPSLGVDLRNGDFARGNYDDDAADLDRLPAHLQVGLAVDLHRGRDGAVDTWLVARSSNGFHAPATTERGSPRSWYESNNLLALVATPAPGLRAAAIYTIKTSPNGVSATTHEASLSFAYEAKSGLGLLKPTLAVTGHAKGGGGLYTQAGIEPELSLAAGDDAAKLSFPAAIGVGWRGFYEQGSGDRLFGNAGVALSKPLTLGGVKVSARASLLALIRDRRLARLSGPDGETGMVVPLATVGLSLAY